MKEALAKAIGEFAGVGSFGLVVVVGGSAKRTRFTRLLLFLVAWVIIGVDEIDSIGVKVS